MTKLDKQTKRHAMYWNILSWTSKAGALIGAFLLGFLVSGCTYYF